MSSTIQRLKTVLTNDKKRRKQVNTIINKLNKSQEQILFAAPLGYLTPNFEKDLLNQNLCTIPKVSRCKVDMLSHILYDKTIDCGN